jgi:hypothetical protein
MVLRVVASCVDYPRPLHRCLGVCQCLTQTLCCCHFGALLLLLQIARQEQIDAVRAELVAKSGGDAEAAFEAERARVGDEKRAELEAQVAAAAAEAEAAAAAAEVRVHMGVTSMRFFVGFSCNETSTQALLVVCNSCY